MPVQQNRVPKRMATVIVNSLKGGVVPRIGLPYITVGRKGEIDALLRDIEVISEGGAAFRFIVGPYGAGKSFLLQTIRNYAMDRNFAVMDADLAPERRLQGAQGQGLATYKELIKNLATRTSPEGGALQLVLDRWISSVQSEVAIATGLDPEDPAFDAAVEKKILEVINELHQLVHGFEFARLLITYFRACRRDDDNTKACVLKWFRGEYAYKRDAKAELGISIIITDADWYEYIKLFAFFLKRAGYNGLLVLIDELVNLYKIPNGITRQYNYEKILAMYNDVLQGKAQWLGILMGGTPQCMEDERRGIFSYEALRSRLKTGRFATSSQAQDLLAPIIRLKPLTAEEMLVLCEKLAAIHAQLFGYTQILTEEDLIEFVKIEFSRVGADSHITPREVIRDFIELLDIVFQHPEKKPAEILGSSSFAAAKPAAQQEKDAQGEFADFEV